METYLEKSCEGTSTNKNTRSKTEVRATTLNLLWKIFKRYHLQVVCETSVHEATSSEISLLNLEIQKPEVFTLVSYYQKGKKN